MTEDDVRPASEAGRELEDPPFDEEALHARRRQYALTAAAIALGAVAVLAIPWRNHVKASGRIAPQRWAHVYTEAPGVVRQVTHTPGDAIQQGEVIAVLDYDEQRDALEAARLALEGKRQKLADLELRLRENSIQREGADAAVRSAGQQAVAAGRIDGARLAALDPVADTALEGVRDFTAGVRAELSRNRGVAEASAFDGEKLYAQVRDAMTRYSSNAATVADQLVRAGGSEAGRQFRFELEDLRFAYDLTDHSMQELLMKEQLVERGFLAPVALREPCIQLEREAMELAHGFRTVSGSARTVLGSPTEQSERVRGAEESRRLLASESERLEAERGSVESEIAAAELAVRTAERHQGKTSIRAPIRGTLAGASLAEFDAVSANASVGVIEDASRLVLKVQVEEPDFRRIKAGQGVEARSADGRTVHGSVIWTTPLAGQAVRDQAWNVLIQIAGGNAGLELGDKLMASIDVGTRSLMSRWFKASDETPVAPRVAFVEDPTELRRPPATLPEPRAVDHDKLAFEGPGVPNGATGR